MPEIGALRLVLERSAARHPSTSSGWSHCCSPRLARRRLARRQGPVAAACKPLLDNGLRLGLLLVLASQNADLAKNVGSPDAGLAERARQAMAVIIRRRPRSLENRGPAPTAETQASDVRAAFASLDAVDPEAGWTSRRIGCCASSRARDRQDSGRGATRDGCLANGNGGGAGVAMSPAEGSPACSPPKRSWRSASRVGRLLSRRTTKSPRIRRCSTCR